MFTRIIIPLIILIALIGGIAGSLYFFRDSLPETFNLFGPSKKETYYEMSNITVPFVSNGTVHKYVHFNIQLSFWNNDDFPTITHFETKLRDIIVRDVYFFLSSRPPQSQLTKEALTARISPLLTPVISAILEGKELPFDIKVSTLLEKENRVFFE